MLTSVRRMVGMPVIWQDRQVGCVERAVPDLRAGRLLGMAVRRGMGGARWTEADAVTVIGRGCVVLARRPVRMTGEMPWMENDVFLITGEPAGSVMDVLINARTLRVEALEISYGPLHHLLGNRAYTCSYTMGGSGVIAAELLTWAQLRSQMKEGERIT